MMRKTFPPTGTICLLSLMFLNGSLFARETKTLARDILRTAGLRPGPALCVQLGCRDGKLTAELARAGNFLVHGLALEESSLEKARKYLQDQKLYGQASVELCGVKGLPYADSLVNLVVADDLARLLEAGLSFREVMRVLCPDGIALLGGRAGSLTEEDLRAKLAEAKIKDFEIIRQNGIWAKIRKPRPEGMDEWTHERHGPDGNAVSNDTALGVPTGLQWVTGPVWPLGGRKTSVPIVISAKGRNFYFTRGKGDQSKVQDRISVLARDAFNGLRLWERVWSSRAVSKHRRSVFDPRGNHTPGAQMPMATDGDRVFTLVKDEVVALNALTGETVTVFGKGIPQDLIYCKNTLLFSSRSPENIRAFDANTGKLRWKHDKKVFDVLTDGKRVFYLDYQKRPYELVCCELTTGKEVWRQKTDPYFPKPEGKKRRKSGRAFGLRFCQNDFLGILGRNGIHLVSAKDGKHLWSFKVSEKEGGRGLQYGGSFFLNGLVWINVKGYWKGIDPATGTEKEKIKGKGGGCQMMAATRRYFLQGRSMSFVEISSGKAAGYGGARGPCAVGILPANGLIYTHSHACKCYSHVIFGYQGLASQAAEKTKPDSENRFEKGPAFNRVGKSQSTSNSPLDDWPCFRGDSRRSGSSSTDVPARLKALWTADFGPKITSLLSEDWRSNPIISGPLTGPVIAGGTLFVALQDRHRIAALDGQTGKKRWSFTAGGRIDSPPTIYKGRCLFGSRDGWVYCLRASDGTLAWRFRAAPRERWITAFGQLESAWPVAGSVLVQSGTLFFVAGRNSGTDGGISVYALEPETGKLLWEKRRPQGFTGSDSVMVGDGKFVYLGKCQFEPKTGKSGVISKRTKNPPTYLRAWPFGLLDYSWTRFPLALRKGMSTWSYGNVISGQLLAFNRTSAFGYARKSPTGIFAKGGASWSLEVKAPTQVEALALVGETLFAAGPLDAAKRNEKGGFLWLISTANGKKAAELKLDAPPVSEGMAAAGGRLYVSTQDGKLLCFGEGR